MRRLLVFKGGNLCIQPFNELIESCCAAFGIIRPGYIDFKTILNRQRFFFKILVLIVQFLEF